MSAVLDKRLATSARVSKANMYTCTADVCNLHVVVLGRLTSEACQHAAIIKRSEQPKRHSRGRFGQARPMRDNEVIERAQAQRISPTSMYFHNTFPPSHSYKHHQNTPS